MIIGTTKQVRELLKKHYISFNAIGILNECDILIEV